jgi:hypothetical protein
VTRAFGIVVAIVSVLLVASYALLATHPFRSAVLASLAFGIMGTFAVVAAVKPVADREDILRDPRVIEERAHAGLLAAFPPFVLAPGVCWHHAGASAPGCACNGTSAL